MNYTGFYEVQSIDYFLQWLQWPPKSPRFQISWQFVKYSFYRVYDGAVVLYAPDVVEKAHLHVITSPLMGKEQLLQIHYRKSNF